MNLKEFELSERMANIENTLALNEDIHTIAAAQHAIIPDTILRYIFLYADQKYFKLITNINNETKNKAMYAPLQPVKNKAIKETN